MCNTKAKVKGSTQKQSNSLYINLCQTSHVLLNHMATENYFHIFPRVTINLLTASCM